MSDKLEHKWVSEGMQPLWKSDGWSIHRRNKTSGKSRGGILAKGLSEYAAKTLCTDANKGSSCFRCKVVSPTGEIFSLMPQLKSAISEMEARSCRRNTFTPQQQETQVAMLGMSFMPSMMPYLS